MRGAVRKFFLLAVPAFVLAAIVSLGLVETWVRVRWDHRRGTPGFYISDARLGQRLAAGYDGWFAGVPVRLNTLGFRDNRDYRLEKPPGTFRILVLGDSVTFGHGSLYEVTYPYLLEQRLAEWRPDVRWEVWNLGVPGYNTRQELTYLEEVGPRFTPDLVIVGFYPNDFTDNAMPSDAWSRRLASAAQRLMQRHMYSYEFFKRVYLTTRWRLLTDDSDRRRLEHLSDESELLSPSQVVATAADQQLSAVDYFDDRQVAEFTCVGEPQVDPRSVGELRTHIHSRSPELVPWLDAVQGLQQLARSGVYRLMFFVNMAPQMCKAQDRFYNAGVLDDDEALLEVLGQGTPVVSSTRAFLHYRPSQMPGANGHSFGNSNRVKADVLFAFLRDRVLPPVPSPR